MELHWPGRPYLSSRGSKSWATEIHVVEKRKNQRKKKSSRRARQRDPRQCTNQRRLRHNRQRTQAPGRVRSSVLTIWSVILSRGAQSLCGNAIFERFCRARLQAGTVDSSTCSPKGERYRWSAWICSTDCARSSSQADKILDSIFRSS